MQSMIRTLFLVALLMTGPVVADTESDIRAALDYFAETWNSGDLEALRGFYHPDFVLVTNDGVIPLGQRLDDLEDIARGGEDRGVLDYSQVSVQALEDKHATAYGKISLKFKDGSAFNEWFTSVYVKTPFGWKAILTHN
jgi:ketosteroid isomerase-like protein